MESLGSNQKEFWSYVRESRGGQSSVPNLVDDEGLTISESVDKANLLNRHYKESFTLDNGCTNDFAMRVDSEMEPIELSVDGIAKLLREVDRKKAPGPEGIPSLVIKTLANEISPLLFVFYRKTLDEGIVPKSWRSAHITPVPKNGRSSKPEDYRPISLTSNFCKIMEHIIANSIMHFLCTKGAISECQHGFCKGRSCYSQPALFVHDLVKAADKGVGTDAVFLDFKKAFDRVSHVKIIHKLMAYGINQQVVKWIQSFLGNRFQRVALDGILSDEICVTSGVPQGSVLGPILFLIYINDIVDNVRCKVRLFADYTVIYREIKTLLNDICCLQNNLNIIAGWCSSRQLDLNVKKCISMNFTHSNSVTHVPYNISGYPFQFVRHHKYLGITLSSSFSFKEHIRNVVGKANRMQSLASRILRGCSWRVKETAYFSLIRPLTEYCCAIWDPHEVGLTSSLEMVQRRAARFVKGDYRFDSSVSVMIESLGWNSLSDRRLDYRRKLFNKFLTTDLREEVVGIAIPVSSVRDLRDKTKKRYREIAARTFSYFWSFFL